MRQEWKLYLTLASVMSRQIYALKNTNGGSIGNWRKVVIFNLVEESKKLKRDVKEKKMPEMLQKLLAY